MIDPNSPTLPAPTVTSPAPGGSPTNVSGPPGTALQIASMLAAGTIDTKQAGSILTLYVAQALTTLRSAAVR